MAPNTSPHCMLLLFTLPMYSSANSLFFFSFIPVFFSLFLRPSSSIIFHRSSAFILIITLHFSLLFSLMLIFSSWKDEDLPLEKKTTRGKRFFFHKFLFRERSSRALKSISHEEKHRKIPRTSET